MLNAETVYGVQHFAIIRVNVDNIAEYLGLNHFNAVLEADEIMNLGPAGMLTARA